MPQPNLVPVSPISSRMTHSSGISGSTSSSCRLPFTVMVSMRLLRLAEVRLADDAPNHPRFVEIRFRLTQRPVACPRSGRPRHHNHLLVVIVPPLPYWRTCTFSSVTRPLDII